MFSSMATHTQHHLKVSELMRTAGVSCMNLNLPQPRIGTCRLQRTRRRKCANRNTSSCHSRLEIVVAIIWLVP